MELIISVGIIIIIVYGLYKASQEDLFTDLNEKKKGSGEYNPSGEKEPIDEDLEEEKAANIVAEEDPIYTKEYVEKQLKPVSGAISRANKPKILAVESETAVPKKTRVRKPKTKKEE